MRTTIQTFSGEWVDPFAVRPEQIHIVDIAHGLARVCRFAGQTVGFHSVARHSVMVATWLGRLGVTKETQMQGLLHDASEAYMCDLPSPLKNRPDMQPYRDAEESFMQAVFRRFELDWPMHQFVHDADKAMLQVDLDYGRYEFDGTPRADESAFFDAFNRLERARAR